MEEINKCAICKKTANQKCGGCHLIYYCTKEHQKTDWKNHKKQCRPFKVIFDDTLGRHLVSTRNIKPGEIVLKEAPIIWGPSQTTVPVCLGCGNEINNGNSKPCTKCGWPMCSEICEKSPAHLPECRYTVQRGDKVSVTNFGIIHPIYQCITVLRCLYQKQFLPKVWKKLDCLQSHCEERKQTPKYENERIAIAQFILKFFKLESVFNETEIMRICGIVMVNGHEIPLSEPNYVAIYENTSMFEHSCSANCNKSFTNNGDILITSGVGIQKGDHLSICYTDPLWGTPNRRHHLYQTKFFWCNCLRCSDPTEFRTYFSAIRCQTSECKGFLLPVTFLENHENEKSADWICDKCKTSVSIYHIQDMLERIGRDLSELPKGDTNVCKEFLKTYQLLLHTNHFYLTDIKIVLAQLIGQENGKNNLTNLSDDDLNLKAQLCRQLNNLLINLIPSEKRIRGILLFELHAAIAEIGRRISMGDGGAPEQLHTSLLESKKILLEAVELLKYEPDVMPEGKIYKQAKINLNEIDVVLRTVHKAIGDSPA